MTVSATSTFELSRDGLIRRAFQLAGLIEVSQSPSADDIALAADLLAMELLALQAEGHSVTQTTRTTLSLVAGTASYSLPSDTLDVHVDPNNFAGTIVPSSGAETPVRAISGAEYVAISDKDTSATPILVYIERLATVAVTFWPVPSATSSFRYAQIRFARDVSTGAVTMDVNRRWQKALCYLLAYQVGFAKSLPPARVKQLRDEAMEQKAWAKNADREKVHMQFYIGRY